MLEAHRLSITDREARGAQKIYFEMKESFEQIGDGIGRIAVVAVKGDNDVSGGVGEALFVAAPVAAHLFPNHFGAEALRHVGGAVRGTIVDNNHLVDELRHPLKHLFDALLFIEARNDDRYGVVLIHKAQL